MHPLATSARCLRQANERLGFHGGCDGAAVVERSGRCAVRVNQARSTAVALHKATDENLCRSTVLAGAIATVQPSVNATNR